MAISLTLAFSPHRPEALPLSERLMTQHDQIVMEEPATSHFDLMVAGRLSIDDYLLSVDFEYPDFARAAACLLRRLTARNIAIWACEPFTERLMEIHDYLADGGRPADLKTNDRLWPVYDAERRATGCLLAFYKAAAEGDFDPLLTAVCEFAAADAARFVLRDQLRGAAIVRRLNHFEGRVYVEAGYLHLRLLRELRRRLPPNTVIRPHYILQDVYMAAGFRAHRYGPGDRLTLALIFGCPPSMERQRLLAARSLIYNRLIIKAELAPGGDELYPDAAEEIKIIDRVERLTLTACRRLHAQLDGIKSLEARRQLMGLPMSVKV